MIFGCYRQPNCWLIKWDFLKHVQKGTNSIIKYVNRKPEQKKNAQKDAKRQLQKKRCKKGMQKRDAKKMQKIKLKNMQRGKPCNRKYASEKIQKWHKTDIKSSSQISHNDGKVSNVKCQV